MPLVHVQLTGKYEPEVKKNFMEFVADTICANTSTFPKNIYVYIHEWERENVRKTAPTVTVDWTEIPDRTPEAKKAIMSAMTDYLAEMTGENKSEIVILLQIFRLKTQCSAAFQDTKIRIGKKTG